MAGSTCELQMNGVCKRFGGVIALDQADLECHRGEVHGLVGENGAGKSTLMRVLFGVLQQDSGQCTLDGKPLVLRSPADGIKAGIGMVFQELGLLPDLTVAQNIFFEHQPVGRWGQISGAALRERCYRLFDEMGIDVADPDDTVGDLGLGQRQMVAIARALSINPQVLILDEAASALARQQAEWLVGFSRKLAGLGKIVIYISHRLGEIRQVADRLTVLRNGKSVGVRTRAEATTEELVSLIVGRPMGRIYPQPEAPVSDEVVFEVKDYRVRARTSVSFGVKRSEILGIGGLSGQGQWELFRALYGMEKARGEVLLEGHPIKISGPHEASKMKLALVPEDRSSQGLLLPKSVSDNISLSSLSFLQRLGLIQRERERRLVQEFVDQLQIKVADVQAPVRRLSGGNQQKVVLAKLLATRPKTLMLFDSTRGVDVGTKTEIYKLLRKLAAAGSSLIWYSTDMDELIHMCDRVLVMRQGAFEAELTGNLLTEENIIRASMGEPINRSASPTPASSVDSSPAKEKTA